MSVGQEELGLARPQRGQYYFRCLGRHGKRNLGVYLPYCLEEGRGDVLGLGDVGASGFAEDQPFAGTPRVFRMWEPLVRGQSGMEIFCDLKSTVLEESNWAGRTTNSFVF